MLRDAGAHRAASLDGRSARHSISVPGLAMAFRVDGRRQLARRRGAVAQVALRRRQRTHRIERLGALGRTRTTERFGRRLDAGYVAERSNKKRAAHGEFRDRRSLAGGCWRGYHDSNILRARALGSRGLGARSCETFADIALAAASFVASIICGGAAAARRWISPASGPSCCRKTTPTTRISASTSAFR